MAVISAHAPLSHRLYVARRLLLAFCLSPSHAGTAAPSLSLSYTQGNGNAHAILVATHSCILIYGRGIACRLRYAVSLALFHTSAPLRCLPYSHTGTKLQCTDCCWPCFSLPLSLIITRAAARSLSHTHAGCCYAVRWLTWAVFLFLLLSYTYALLRYLSFSCTYDRLMCSTQTAASHLSRSLSSHTHTGGCGVGLSLSLSLSHTQ